MAFYSAWRIHLSMEIVNIQDGEAQLSRILERVERGEEIVIARAGVPIARLSRYRASQPKRQGGQWKGKVWMSDDFDTPLPDEILRAFNDGPTGPTRSSVPGGDSHG